MMKTLLKLLMLIFNPVVCGAYDFTYSYDDIYEAQADDYIISTVNMQRYDEGIVTYWCPINNGTEAILTQKFTFSAKTTEIFMFTKLSSYNFGGNSFGSGSFWASTDGVNWQLLLDAPTPVSVDSYKSFSGNLPQSLLGATTLYTQTRLTTSDWNILAQWGRPSDPPGPGFQLKANLVSGSDTTPPVVAVHTNVTAQATSAAGAIVNYAPATAADAVGVTSLTYSQNSGTVFPIGVTTVTITAKDAANNTSTGTFTVTVSDITSGLVAYYPFDGNANDQTGGGYNGTVNGAQLTFDRFGTPSAAYNFNGTSNYIIVNKLLPDSQGFTISAWIRPQALKAAGIFYDSALFTAGRDTTFQTLVNGSLQTQFTKISEPGPPTLFSNPVLTTGVWIHVVATTEPSGTTIYVNGSSAATQVAGSHNTGYHSNPYIGAENHGFQVEAFFHGDMDDIRIYNRALSAVDVQYLHTTETGTDTQPPTLNLPTNIIAEATGASGAVVSFNVSASDTVSGVLTPSVNPPSGSTFSLGATTVNVSAIDEAGNTQIGSFTVTVRDTIAPVLAAHASMTVEATSAVGATVDYAAATATDAVTVSPAITYSQKSGTVFSFGTTLVIITAKDAANNQSTKTFTVTVQDTFAPTISGTFAPLTVFTGTLPDYRSQAVKSDSVGVTSVTQSPAQGSAVTVGAVLVTLTAHDAAGNTKDVTFTVSVRPLAAVTTTQFAQGATAPGAGTNGLPVDAKLASFGPPATDDAGDVAFVAKWKGATGKGTGLFLNDKCLGIVGGDASAIVAGAKYASFTDPVVEGGKVVCIAKLSTGESAVVSNFTGTALEKIALTGAIAADVGGAKFKSFKAVALRGGSLGFLGQLTGGTGANKVTADNDRAEWVREPGAALHLVYRDGFDLGNLAFVAFFTSFQPGIGSPGQGRGWLSHNQQGLVLSLNTLTDKTKAIVFGGDGGDTFLARTGVVGTNFAPALAGASFASFRYPAMNDALANTFYATMKVGAGGVTKADAGGIFASTADFGGSLAPYALLARTGKPSGVLGANFSTLSDPVLSPDGGIAFPAVLKGGTAKGPLTQTLWWKPAAQPLSLLAQGGQRPGLDLPALAQWKAFTSLAITDRGPLFAATLVAGKGGVTAKTATGVWACDFTGAARSLFLTGDAIGGKKLAKFTLLKVTVGNAGVTRSFNNTAQVVWLATFTDKSTAILTTDVP